MNITRCCWACSTIFHQQGQLCPSCLLLLTGSSGRCIIAILEDGSWFCWNDDNNCWDRRTQPLLEKPDDLKRSPST